MRDFHMTSEPGGSSRGSAASKSAALPFVIQKHAATRLHYDFRLGWNGVLKSWAVAKGPSYFPGDKRLAVEVEDHPIEYGGFEGIIPKGQYGGGTVMVWDQGTWQPHVDVDEGLRKGSLKFALHGEKMKGNWALIRMNSRAQGNGKPNWLLIKEHDEFERAAGDEPITEKEPDSAVTGRSLDEIADAEDHVWQSKGAESRPPAKTAARPAPIAQPAAAKTKSPRTARPKPPSIPANAPKEKLPSFIAPQLAVQVGQPPRQGGWLHEIKLDGYRIQARIDRKEKSPVKLLTRTGLDWTHRMKPIAAALANLPVNAALLDGEVVVLSHDGTSSFADLQAAFQEGANKPLHYFVFDLLHLDGRNLRGLPLEQRKRLLAGVLASNAAGDAIRLNEHLEGDAAVLFSKICELGAEGLISKRSDSKYTSGRAGAWLKLKCYREQELAIGGFTYPSNGTYGVGALLLGYYRDGKLVYAGRTGTGFTQKIHKMLRGRLEKLVRQTSPFESLPVAARSGAHWVKPELVAQVSFSTWTADNLVRQAAFKGLRDDKPACEVRKEEAMETAPQQTSDADATHPKKSTAGKRGAPVANGNSSPLPAPLNVRLTHPDKVLDSESGLTKQQLAQYYSDIASYMLPYIADRPLSLVRCPEGSGKPCFFQKHNNTMLPDDIGSVEIVDKKTGKPEPYITLSTATAMVGLAQMGVLEIHPWGSLNRSLETPDRIVFDLDPSEAIDWPALAGAAIEVRDRLKRIGLTSFVKTTGGKGLHVVVRIEPEHRWPAVKEFAHRFVLAMEKDNPKLYLTKMTKAARAGKIYLDYLRNERGATSVAPYSPRARAGMPVSLPLNWSELTSQSSVRPRFLVSKFAEWKKRLARDPWKTMIGKKQHLILVESK